MLQNSVMDEEVMLKSAFGEAANQACKRGPRTALWGGRRTPKTIGVMRMMLVLQGDCSFGELLLLPKSKFLGPDWHACEPLPHQKLSFWELPPHFWEPLLDACKSLPHQNHCCPRVPFLGACLQFFALPPRSLGNHFLWRSFG